MSHAVAEIDLEQIVDAFESAHREDGRAELETFLPPPGDPNFLAVVRELVCVDLDYGWTRGEPTPLDEYRRRFPALFADAAAARAVVWEDYRQRRQAGQEPDPEDYRRRYGVSPADSGMVSPNAPTFNGGKGHKEWQARLDGLGTGIAPGAADLYQAARHSHPAAADRYARAITALPRAGETFAGFRLEAELGQGTFGRVFLARQIALADRPVALKVSPELFGEEQTLARLQHTNIVPIYSPHQVGPLQAVAMPYFGSTTLADVIQALGKHALPASGKHFVSTLHGRKKSTVVSRNANTPASPSQRGRGPKQLETSPASSLGQGPEGLDATAPATEALANLERFTYPDAVLWLAARLADGLAHAHERGIIHRDLKPANILLKDDGQPMLLDFNLADTALRSSEAGARVGGTLPYMAPEHIRAFENLGPAKPSYAADGTPISGGIDGRSDIYSLGLILFELLTGRTAFPEPAECGSAGITLMLLDRAGPPPRLRPLNPTVSPAAEAIVRRCLEPDPANRYQSARELQEDIERHLAHLPLKHAAEPSVRERLNKWVARHPRMTSGTSVAVLAAVFVMALAATAWGLHREVQRRSATAALQDLMTQSDAVLPRLIRSLDSRSRDAAVASARNAVAPYGVLDRADWQTAPLVSQLPPAERDRLRGRMGELLFLMTQAELGGQPGGLPAALKLSDLAAGCYVESPPRAWWEQRAAVFEKLGDSGSAARAADQAKQLELRTPTDLYLAALRLSETGRYAEALPLLARATAADPRHFWAWFLRGNCHFFQGQAAEAARCYSVCIGLDPTQARPYFNRARVLTGQRAWLPATEDFDQAVALAPDWIEAQVDAADIRLRRAVAMGLPSSPLTARYDLLAKAGAGLPGDQAKLLRDAEARFTEILRKPEAPVRCYFHRAEVRLILGNKAGWKADREMGFAREPGPNDDSSWVARGLARPQSEGEKSLDDYRHAEHINPQSPGALQNQVRVLTQLNKPLEALAVADRLVALFPDYAEARSGRAVLLARQGRTKEALADAEWVKTHVADPLVTYQIGGVYALAGDTPEALRLVASALTRGAGFSQLATDRELDPIRDRPEFVRLVDAVRTLQGYLKPAAKPAGSPATSHP